MKETEEYKQAMLELFAALPHGGIKKLAELAGMTPQKLYGVRDCEFRNDKVVELAKQIILDHKRSLAQREKELVAFVEKEIRGPQSEGRRMTA